ncbi:MAG: hypothetical protein U0903_01135 [Planctomycetales bacterium]
MCDDSTFLRRVYLDTSPGKLPTEETRLFLADKDPQARQG